MTITTKWNDVTTEGVSVGVSIKKKQHEQIEEELAEAKEDEDNE